MPDEKKFAGLLAFCADAKRGQFDVGTLCRGSTWSASPKVGV
jgi:hypothetical protein